MTREDLIAKATSAIDTALIFPRASISLDIENGRASILVYSNLGDGSANVDRALTIVPRIRRTKFGGDKIAGCFTTADGVEVTLANIAQCPITYEEIEEPEYAPTGKTIKRIVTRYDCPQEATA